MKKLLLLVLAVFLLTTLWGKKEEYDYGKYHSPKQVNSVLKKYAGSNSKFVKMHTIAGTPDGNSVALLEIGPEVKNKVKKYPAVLVVANLEGDVPLASEAAVYLIETIIKDTKVRNDKTWYIVPFGNPDAADNYFKNPLYLDNGNGRPHNDDMDDRTDEDGVEDLDKNGVITRMRVKDPMGEWIPVKGEPRLMKKADSSKGEKGIYKVYSEGIDNDGDGAYNEDGRGGVNIGINFPHLFKHHTKKGGQWPGSELESYNLMKFVYEHPEIGLTFVFGKTNFCLTPPRGGRRGSVDFSKIKIPERIGKFMGVDTDRTYTMKEVMEIAKRFVPEGMEVTESMIASFFGLGAVVNPLPADLKFYNKLSEDYKEYLKKKKIDTKRLEPEKAKDGSFELWAYYHLGLPSFSMDFWTLPEVKEEKKQTATITPEKLEAMSKEEFLALGEEKIDAFLKSSGAPGNVKAKMLINAVKGGMLTPKKMAEMMKRMGGAKKDKEGISKEDKAMLAFNKTVLKGKGFINWKPYTHPVLGKVEIGGVVPYLFTTPPASMIKDLVTPQIPWIFKVTDQMARIKFKDTRVKALGNGLYKVEAWVENSGFLPYPIAMGSRNQRIQPVVVEIKDKNIKIIEGKRRSLIKAVGGLKTQKVEWLIDAGTAASLGLKLSTRIAYNDSVTINLRRTK